jgi:DUF218 domain
VLAGRECRKQFALTLLQQGWAPTLLLSVGRFEIRPFSSLKLPKSLDLLAVASATDPPRRHYFVRIDSQSAEAQRIAVVGRFGTWNEIRAFADWLRTHHPIRSVTVVSSGFHLKRIRMCCRRLLPEDTRLSFVAVPAEGQYLREHWWQDPSARKLVLSELMKLAVYRVVSQGSARRGWSATAFSEG